MTIEPKGLVIRATDRHDVTVTNSGLRTKPMTA